MKIVHAADLHIDSPLRGLRRIPDAPVDTFRRATRDALVRLTDLCLEEEAALLLLAGDVFDGDWQDYNTGLFFARQMGRLTEAGVRVVQVRGNHDAASRITRHLRMPERFHDLDTAAPETVVFEDLGVAVHGQGYADQHTTADLAAAYPPPVAGALNFGLLHTNATGAAEHAPYAPCTVARLAAHGYEYWALGHVHGRAVLQAAPWIVYPGNLQGRNARETGAKGAMVIEADGARILTVEPRDLDVVRWHRLELDEVTDATIDGLCAAAEEQLAPLLDAAGDRPMLVRVVVSGATDSHGALEAGRHDLRANLEATLGASGDAWLEKLELAIRPRVAHVPPPGGLLADLHERLATLDDVTARAGLADELQALDRKLGAAHGAAASDPERLERLLPRVRDLLTRRLGGEG